MTRNETRRAGRIAQVRRVCHLALGPVLMLLSPAVGLIPGPGGLIVFIAGLAVTLQASHVAKRTYVRIKRRWPRVGHWSDKGLRRPSHFRRLRRRQQARGATGSN
ncbi:MAG TPA: hypothetical protein VL331_13100 [Croceibacterium sp.]|jgi:hypothetical protein|nr:hypothetical protein [Croceibacterium sp.]